MERRVKVFCVTCSFAPDDLFFPVIITAAIKGTWFLFSFAVCIAIFAQSSCDKGVSNILAVSIVGFVFLQLVAFLHKFIILIVSARGTIRDPKHAFVRELILIGVVLYVVELVWAVYSMVAVLDRSTVEKSFCNGNQKPFFVYVILVWSNWLELVILALIYFSCLDRCKCFFCRAVCAVQCNCFRDTQEPPPNDHPLSVEARIKVTPTSHSLSASHLSSIIREKCCSCRQNGLNNSKNIALNDLSHALEVLYHDIEIHFTVLDRLSGWTLVQNYHTQLLRQGNDNLVIDELLQATLHFLKKKGVIHQNHAIREPQPLGNDSRVPEILLHYYWFAMASYGWTIKIFLEPLSGLYSICRHTRLSCCVSGSESRFQEKKTTLFHKSAEVASIAGIHESDIFLGRSINDIHCPPFYVCQTVRHDAVTGEMKKEVVITIRGTLSVKDVMTSFTASMRDATKCQESLVEKWFLLLVKTKLTFLGVKDAYFHTGFYKSAKVILNLLRKNDLFKELIEKQKYRVVVTGHSLGAGVGAILTLLIKHKHPQWANGLHAYLYSVPGAVCSYELAERAEALGIITSVVGAYDIVPRISWRALSYLKLLVSKALDETSIKKQEVLCCGNLPHWNPPIFDGSTHPVGLLSEESEDFTPSFLELQESLPVIRRSTWDPEIGKRETKEQTGKNIMEVLVEDNDVQYQERRRTKPEEEFKKHQNRDKLEPIAEIGPVEIAPLEDHGKVNVEKVATSFLQEKSRLGPLMFLPGHVLHIEEEGHEAIARWCGIGVLGMRCCGVRCTNDRQQVKASWKAREVMTGIILHRDCLVDHSPRRTFAMLQCLVNQTVGKISSSFSASPSGLAKECISNGDSQQEAKDQSPSVVGVSSEYIETNDSSPQEVVVTEEISVEVHEQSEL